MSQWARTLEGDMLLPSRGNGASAIVRDVATCTAIKLKSVFQFVQGEWFLDTQKGFPWVPIWTSKNPHLPSLRLLFRKTILATSPPVVSVTDFAITYDRPSRNLRYLPFAAKLANGQTVTVS